MNNNKIFEKNSFFNGAIILFGIFCIVRIGLGFIVDATTFNIFYPTIAITFVLILLFNTKWIYRVVVLETGIQYTYPLNFIGKKNIRIDYNQIKNISFHGYAYNSPSHFKLKSSNGNFRFNCSEDYAEKLFEFFKTKDIDVSYDDEKEVGYRK